MEQLSINGTVVSKDAVGLAFRAGFHRVLSFTEALHIDVQSRGDRLHGLEGGHPFGFDSLNRPKVESGGGRQFLLGPGSPLSFVSHAFGIDFHRCARPCSVHFRFGSNGGEGYGRPETVARQSYDSKTTVCSFNPFGAEARAREAAGRSESCFRALYWLQTVHSNSDHPVDRRS